MPVSEVGIFLVAALPRLCGVAARIPMHTMQLRRCRFAQKERRRAAYQLKIRRCHEFIKRVRNLFEETWGISGRGIQTEPSFI